MTDTVVRESVDRSPGRDPESRSKTSRGQWRPLLVRMHFYAGVLVAPFIFLACLTGAIYVFNPQIDRLMEPGLLVVEHPGTTPLPLNRQVAAAMASEPGLNVVSVVPNARPDETTRVNLYRPGGADMTNHTVFVNPYTAQVQGSKDISTMGGAMPFSTWMAQFHGDLNLGEFGRWYSEMASLWIVILTLGGIVVWWQRCAVHRSITSGRFWKKFGVVDRGRRPGVKRTMSWHSVIGVWTAVLALLFGLTGLPFARTSGPKWVAQTGNMHRSSVQLDTKLPGAPDSGSTTGGTRSGGQSGMPGDMSGMPGDMSGMPGDMSGMSGGQSGMTGSMSGKSGKPAPTGAPDASASSGTSGTAHTGSAGGQPTGSAPSAGTGSRNGGASMGGSGGRPGGSGGAGGAGGSGGSGGMHGMTMATGIPQAMVAKADLDGMITAARAAGVDQKVRISTPTRPGTGWVIAENKQDWPVAYDSALIDPKSGTVVRTLDWNKVTPTVDKVNRYIMLFHFGRLFGFAGEVLFGLTMLAVMWIVWWGYKMWWQRRPRGTAWRLGKVPDRGSWRKAPKVSLAIWGAVTLAVFWVFPVLAVSALGFVVLDAALGRIQAARSRTTAPAAG